MLIEQVHYPLGEDENFPWGKVILAVVIVGGIGFMSYQAIKPTLPPLETKTQ